MQIMHVKMEASRRRTSHPYPIHTVSSNEVCFAQLFSICFTFAFLYLLSTPIILSGVCSLKTRVIVQILLKKKLFNIIRFETFFNVVQFI